jgi:hypothetical protein
MLNEIYNVVVAASWVGVENTTPCYLWCKMCIVNIRTLEQLLSNFFHFEQLFEQLFEILEQLFDIFWATFSKFGSTIWLCLIVGDWNFFAGLRYQADVVKVSTLGWVE